MHSVWRGWGVWGCARPGEMLAVMGASMESNKVLRLCAAAGNNRGTKRTVALEKLRSIAEINPRNCVLLWGQDPVRQALLKAAKDEDPGAFETYFILAQADPNKAAMWEDKSVQQVLIEGAGPGQSDRVNKEAIKALSALSVSDANKVSMRNSEPLMVALTRPGPWGSPEDEEEADKAFYSINNIGVDTQVKQAAGAGLPSP